MSNTTDSMEGKTEWRDVVGYEGLYQVSNEGWVRSVEHTINFVDVRCKELVQRLRKSRVMKQRVERNGYCRIELTLGVDRTKHLVHRLVAKAFLPNKDDLPQVNHINEVKDDNCVENLEWCTAEYNQQYSSPLNKNDIKNMLFDFYYGLSNTTIAERLNVSQKSIHDIRTGKSWSSVTGITKEVSA